MFDSQIINQEIMQLKLFVERKLDISKEMIKYSL